MTLAHTAETNRIARIRQNRFMLGKLEVIPSRIHYDFITRRSFKYAHPHLTGRLYGIDL